jgi:radical SAM-linked protein
MSAVSRVRIRFVKLGKVRWTSHRDVARMWERAFRRLRLPLAYTEGFSPRPKVSFGLALPTGHESEAEYLDVEFAPGADIRVEELPAHLSLALPNGVDAVGAVWIEPGTPSLQEAVTASSWRFAAAWPPAQRPAEPAAAVASLLDAAALVVPRCRKGADVDEDIRPGILSLRLLRDEEVPADAPVADAVWLEAELAAQPRSLRPLDVVRALGPEVSERHVRRLHQWILRDGARWEPVAAPPDATAAPRALEHAS